MPLVARKGTPALIAIATMGDPVVASPQPHWQVYQSRRKVAKCSFRQQLFCTWPSKAAAAKWLRSFAIGFSSSEAVMLGSQATGEVRQRLLLGIADIEWQAAPAVQSRMTLAV